MENCRRISPTEELTQMVKIIRAHGGDVKCHTHDNQYISYSATNGKTNVVFMMTSAEPGDALWNAVEAAYKDILRQEKV